VIRASSTAGRVVAAAVAAAALVAGTPGTATAAIAPDLVPPLSGYTAIWQADRGATLRGTVVDAATLQRDDEVAVWINRHASKAERLLALQDAQKQTEAGTAYDQSITLSTALGSELGPLYVEGRRSDALPLTSALVDTSTGSAGAFVTTSAAKAAYSHPRPFVPTDPSTPAVNGDASTCAPAAVNAASQAAIRVGRPYADARGDLAIVRVPPTTDTTHRFSSNDVPLDAGYSGESLCRGGSFPSGHTTAAYSVGITLATLLPELAPEILARASEAGNNRIVLGVHYPLDVVGGRISGEVALAARWSDPTFRSEVLEPARQELVRYLERRSGHPIARVVAHQRPYRSDPYDGWSMPGGSSQIVTDRASAVRVYTERLTYGFAPTAMPVRTPSVPDGAQNLLRTTFPTLSAPQREAVLAQTSLPSGFPLDGTGTDEGSWQRLDLAAAMSATVAVDAEGAVRVVGVGGAAQVVDAR
jgi:membrane-associated phospholipid phosphatase